uniref:Uncharacterized protein n=1 Tax=Alexandrium monilatum TaxID=311494 RepID=A0A7S4T1B4_9DINO|mmetsp:Transcript_41176/g.128338  ORF Transcript_41176/g.128338 Transcript_41176/m.128338 type:complete len:474 (-) Transcript_41176:31-1452(-)
MDGVWLEDGSFKAAPGQKGKGKAKGGKCKGKGKFQDNPAAKKPRLGEPDLPDKEPEEKADEFDFDGDWKDKQVCLVNLKAAALNGVMGSVKEYLGAEEVLVDGKKKTIRRFLVALEGGKGDKSIKLENLFKVMTGALVKLRGLDAVELNDSVGECGRLDAATMRYDVTLSDGRHVKAKPANVDFVARYEASRAAGDAAQMERFRSANGLSDRLAIVEEFQHPAPQLLPAAALADYAQRFPKSVVIGRSNAAHPKGIQALGREAVSATRAAAGARLIFASVPREQCVAPPLADMRHDELVRLGKFSAWVAKRCAPRPVYFLLPSVAAKGPPTALAAATCAWPLYLGLCTDVVALESERWRRSAWARLDALLAVWARRPLYLLPEGYQAPVELPGAPGPTGTGGGGEGGAGEAQEACPLSLRPEEPLTISRPTEGVAAPPPLLAALAERAAEAEAGGAAGAAKVQCPTLAVRRLG